MSFTLQHTEHNTQASLGVHKFELPLISEHDNSSTPIVLFMGAGTLAGDALSTLEQINNDGRLTALGKEEKSGPLKSEVVERVASASALLNDFVASVDKREAELLALPVLDPTAAAVAIEDREIRDWWRGLDTAARASHLSAIAQNPTEHERLMIAILRAPAPLAMLDHEATAVREMWVDARRANNPEIAEAIDGDRHLVKIAERGIAHLAAITKQVANFDTRKALSVLLDSKYEPARRGYAVFGVEERAAAQGRRERVRIGGGGAYR